MKSVKTKVVALVVCWLLLAGGAAEVLAQRYRVRVYNPGRHARTRQATSNRAAARAALKKKKKAATVNRAISRQTVN
jgi:hypothetical protein